MRDRRDYLIAALVAGLLFCVGLLAGRELGPTLPAAQAQDTPDAVDPGQPINPPPSAPTGQPPGGITINPPMSVRPGTEGRTVAPTASDSNSNNRFVAVTCPVGSGESVLFLIDSKHEQLAVYRFVRNKGLEFLAGRKIDIDLRLHAYRDRSEFSRDEMKRMYEKELARAAAKAVKRR